jgi:hypothetical protein
MEIWIPTADTAISHLFFVFKTLSLYIQVKSKSIFPPIRRLQQNHKSVRQQPGDRFMPGPSTVPQLSTEWMYPMGEAAVLGISIY